MSGFRGYKGLLRRRGGDLVSFVEIFAASEILTISRFPAAAAIGGNF